MTKLFNLDKQKSSLIREDLGGYQQYKSVEVDTHPQPFPNKGREKQAFTLAEVLITLAIIGVVAAMTIPTLIQDFKKREASVKIKRFYSAMTQAIQLSEIDNGPALSWGIKDYKDEDGNLLDDSIRLENALIFYNKYIRPYLKLAKEQTNEEIARRYDIFLIDGSMFSISNGSCTDFIYDTNGLKPPNANGQDKFYFLLCDEKNNKLHHLHTPNRAFGTYGHHTATPSFERSEALKSCEKTPIMCSTLLELFDNWEFKDDYPHKL